MGSIAPARPGIMVVHPRLHDPTPENEATFLRWTKVHDRDVLGLDGEQGSVTRTLRFGRELDAGEKDGSRLFYTILATNISAFKTPEYYAISRRLDLENTRPLNPGEEAVNCKEGLMVWDLVDAQFTIYEQVPISSQSNESGPKTASSFQDFPLHLTGTHGANPLSRLVGLSFPASSALLDVQKHLAELLGFFGRVPEALSVYASLYRHAGAEAHPEMHPVIASDEVGGGQWLGLVLIVDEGGKTLQGDHVIEMVRKWAENGGSVEVKFGVWDGQMFMA